MNLKGKKLLVTGSDGFIGSHLTETLVKLGCDVRAFVYYNSFNSHGWLDHAARDIIENVEVFAGDIRDPYGVKSAMKGCDVVFHLAALIGIPYSYHSPETYVETNIKGTLNVLQAARELETERVVHTSTSEVYGTALTVPIDENHPLQGQSPYSATKIGADQMALAFHRSFGLPLTVARPFNTYGPRQSARAIIPTVISQIAAGNRTLNLGSLHPTRDFSYVQDTVDGFIALSQADSALGEVVNLGSGFEISIGETVQLIATLMKAEVQIESASERVRPEKSEVERLWASTEKARKLASWTPKYAGKEGFSRGLQRTIDWFSEPGNLGRYRPESYNI